MIVNNPAGDAAKMREQQEAAAEGLRDRLWAERARVRRLERDAREAEAALEARQRAAAKKAAWL